MTRSIFLAAALLLPLGLLAEIKVQDPAKPREGIAVEQARSETGAPVVRSGNDQMVFLTGDRCSGQLLSIDPAKGLLYKLADADQPVLFKTDRINNITLGSTGSGQGGGTRVNLTNGDTLIGTVTEITADKVVLDTWYAGTLSIERMMVKSISAGQAAAKSVYSGPGDMSGWNRQGNGWTVKDGGLQFDGSYGTIGREVKLPERSVMEFTLEHRGNIQISALLYGDSKDASGGNVYMLTFNNNYLQAQRMTTNEGGDSMGHFPMRNGLRSGARVSLYTDKTTKTLSVVIDGKLVRSFTDSNDFAGKGNIIGFQGQNGQVRVTDLRVSPWDGRLPGEEGKAPKEGAANASKTDVCTFGNGDIQSGTLKTLKAGVATFSTNFGDLQIPLERVALLELSQEEAEKARKNAGDVELIMAGIGKVTLKLNALSEDAVQGESENFGKGSFNIKAFNNLRMNIYKERPAEKKSEW
ncbi:MAG: hypothetical protein RL095_2809 [Verrucomicrobiota bacterium]|jgi:hypothetical protein